jgi:hypothetical protein
VETESVSETSVYWDYLERLWVQVHFTAFSCRTKFKTFIFTAFFALRLGLCIAAFAWLYHYHHHHRRRRRRRLHTPRWALASLSKCRQRLLSWVAVKQFQQSSFLVSSSTPSIHLDIGRPRSLWLPVFVHKIFLGNCLCKQDYYAISMCKIYVVLFRSVKNVT